MPRFEWKDEDMRYSIAAFPLVGAVIGLLFYGLFRGAAYLGLPDAAAALLLERVNFGEPAGSHRNLKITIPENLDYEGLFDDLFAQFTRSHELTRVRTTNMGTLYELSYAIELKSPDKTKDFIDAIRCRNGNLNVVCGREAERDVM